MYLGNNDNDKEMTDIITEQINDKGYIKYLRSTLESKD